MTKPGKEKSVTSNIPQDMKKLHKEPPVAGDICEICGATLECDPESGECYCPECFYEDEEA
ncbi:MAG: hypothetical protein PHO83_08010 [Geobacteraceae bacterium]|nr:hypothetical protein [Geobacteraceae bacterium]